MPCGCAAGNYVIFDNGFEAVIHRTGCPEPARDAWIEALLGARLRFHLPENTIEAGRLYRRWSQLYHGHAPFEIA